MSEPQSAVTRGLLLAPAVAVFGGLFAVPLAYFLVVSFFRVSFFRIVPEFGFANYVNVLGNYAGPLALTMAVGLAVSLVTLLLAFVIAHLIWTASPRFGGALLACTMLNLFGGYLVKIYAWRTLLGRDGLVNAGLTGLGLTDAPAEWLLFSPLAVVLVLVNYLLPFAILPIYGALRSIRPVALEAARDLGASPFRVLHDIVLPHCRTALVTAFSLAFLVAAGDYVTPRLVGGTRSVMIGTFIESQFGMRLNVPLGAAMTFTTLATSIAVIWLFRTLLRWELRAR